MLIEFLVMAISIIVKSYFDSAGYLSPDSVAYLVGAQNLIDGEGFYLFSCNERMFFAAWPVGYSYAIFLICKIFGVSVFIGSKLLNILIFGLILLLLRKLFMKRAYIYGMLFFAASYIIIFSYTWSEVPFIFGLVLFVASVHDFVAVTGRAKHEIVKPALLILAAMLILFLSRYAGFFSLGIIGLLFLYFVFIKRDYVRSMTLVIVGILFATFVFLYLYNNALQTGFLTGQPRGPARETHFFLLLDLAKAFLYESILPYAASFKVSFKYKLVSIIVLSILQFIGVVVLILYLKQKKNKGKGKVDSLKDSKEVGIDVSVVFITVGICYIVAIVILRWNAHFDPFGYRLLGPGVILLFIGLLKYIEERFNPRQFNGIALYILYLSVISIFVNVPLNICIRFNGEPTYYERINDITKPYLKVPSNSIVVFGENDLRYLRSDLVFCAPFSSEKWNDFLSRMRTYKYKYIFVKVPNDLTEDKYDVSTISAMSKYKAGDVVKIK